MVSIAIIIKILVSCQVFSVHICQYKNIDGLKVQSVQWYKLSEDNRPIIIICWFDKLNSMIFEASTHKLLKQT